MSRPTAAMTKPSLRQPLAVSLNINHRYGPTELKLGDEFEEERRRGLVLIHKEIAILGMVKEEVTMRSNAAKVQAPVAGIGGQCPFQGGPKRWTQSLSKVSSPPRIGIKAFGG